ncbi:MAG: divergent polysaccharide deacetylase family protein [Bacillota bacterium]
MIKFNRIMTMLLVFSLILLLTSCGTEDEESLGPQEDQRTEINYETKVKQLEEDLKSVLATIEVEEDYNVAKSVTKTKKTDKYQFSWTHNSSQLQVPLYGSEGKLLSDYRSEIIEKFKAKFNIVDVSWEEDTKQRLVLNLGFNAKGDFELMSHQVVLSQPQPKAKLAIVIDDFGFDRQGTAEILSIDRPLTGAVLPFRPHSAKDAKLASEAGLEVVLHQPLEPMNPDTDPGEGAIDTTMESQEIKETLLKNLDSLDNVSGVNHHMGSKASTDKQVMNSIISLLKDRDLFYVDSSTSHESVGVQIAREQNLPTFENYLFIDNVDHQQDVEEMIMNLAKIALEKEELLIIGHVKENTADAIKESIPKLEEMGIKLVYASQLVK